MTMRIFALILLILLIVAFWLNRRVSTVFLALLLGLALASTGGNAAEIGRWVNSHGRMVAGAVASWL